MTQSSVYELFQKMDADNVLFAYKGEISSELLESVYSMMDKLLEENKTSPQRKKKFFQILVESLQNIFHHQIDVPGGLTGRNVAETGFLIKIGESGSYEIITGNYMLNDGIDELKDKIDMVNGMTPEALRAHYQESLAGSDYSDKGGAGLGIIDMARKSGKKLKYEFTSVNDRYSFFSLSITIP